MRKHIYYTVESFDGRVFFATKSYRMAKRCCGGEANDGICYKRKDNNLSYKKFAFMW